MSTLNIFQISFEIWGCIIGIMIAMILGVSTFREHDQTGKKLWCMVLFNNNMLVCDALAYIYRGDLSQIGTIMTRFSNFSMFLMEYVILYCFVGYVESLTSQDTRSRWKTIALILEVIAFLGLALTPFTRLYYSFDTLNRYRRGPGIWISFAACGAIILICMYRLYAYRKQLSKTQLQVFLSCISIFCICMLLQFIVYGLSFINIALTVCIHLLYFMHVKQQYENHWNWSIEQAIQDTTEYIEWKMTHQERKCCDETDKE